MRRNGISTGLTDSRPTGVVYAVPLGKRSVAKRGMLRDGVGWLQRCWLDKAGGAARQAELGRVRVHCVRVHAAVRPPALRDGLHLPAGRRFDPPLQAHARVLRGARGSGAAVAGTLARPQSDRKSLVDHEPPCVR
jgi:hypothetical protein